MIEVNSLVKHTDPKWYGGKWRGLVLEVAGASARVTWDPSLEEAQGLWYPLSVLELDPKAETHGMVG